MGAQKTLTSSWNDWFPYHEKDPVVRLVGTSDTRDPQQVRAVFETLSGLRVEGDVGELRALEYELVHPHRRIKGMMEVYDYGRMSEREHDRWLQVSGGIDLIHDRQTFLKYDNAAQLADYEVRRIMKLGARPV